MSEYKGQFAKYYDLIHSDKDYENEVRFLIKAFHKFLPHTLEEIVDIGCGTGRHSAEMGKLGYKVTGVDPSPDMILIAKKHFGEIANCEFINGFSSDLKGKYQLAVSMFNVINHIMSLDELIRFFESVRRLLVDDGLFIFDCFNGVAAMMDPPRNRTIEKEIPNYGKMSITTLCETSLMESRVIMHNTIEYKDEVFSFDLEHRLWTPEVLRQILNMVNFKIIRITSNKDFNTDATIDNYKIMFLCQS